MAYGFNADKSKAEVYTKTESDNKYALSQNTYTKSETDTRLNQKANSSSVYTQTQIDNMFNNLFLVEAKEKAISSISANMSVSGYFSVSKSGYSTIGLAGFSASTKVDVNSIIVSNEEVSYTLSAKSTATGTFPLTVYVLYKKNN